MTEFKPGDRVVWASASGPRPGVVLEIDKSGEGKPGAWSVLAVLHLDGEAEGRESFVNAREVRTLDEEDVS